MKLYRVHKKIMQAWKNGNTGKKMRDLRAERGVGRRSKIKEE